MFQISVPTGLFSQTPEGFYTRGDTKFNLPSLEQMEEDRRIREKQAREKAPEALSDYFDVLKSASSDYSTYTGHDARRESERLFQEDLITTLSKSDASNLLRPLSYDLSDVDIGEFTFDKTLEDFRGPEGNWLYGDISNENLKAFQEELLPVMAKAVAKEQLDTHGKGERIGDYVGIPWSEALTGAIANNPEVQQIYQKYGVSPTRTDKEGSQYLYDPFSFQEIRTLDLSSDWRDTARGIALTLAGGALLGPLAGSITSGLGVTGAAGTALSGALSGAGTAAITGGDPLKGALTGGLGGYAKGLSTTAKAAETAAKGAKAGSELAKAAELARKTSDTFNTVVKTGKFVDAAIDGDLGSMAVAAFGDDFTKAALDKIDPDDKFFSGLNINKSDLTKGLVKTQMELAKGTDFEDALLRGVGEYIMEGGALGPNNIKTPEFIKAIGDVLQDAGRMIDDTFLQPIKEIAEPVIDVAEDVGRAVDKEVLQPAKEVVQEVTEPVTKPLVKGAKAVGETVGDVAGVVEDVIEALPNPNLPRVDLPKVGTPPFFPVTPTSTSTPTPTYAYTPGIIEERGAELFDLGGKQERKVDPVEAYLASLAAGGMANGGAVRSSYGNLDELLRIVGGR